MMMMAAAAAAAAGAVPSGTPAELAAKKIFVGPRASEIAELLFFLECPDASVAQLH